jgi:hypothetical protein
VHDPHAGVPAPEEEHKMSPASGRDHRGSSLAYVNLLRTKDYVVVVVVVSMNLYLQLTTPDLKKQQETRRCLLD